MLMEPSTTSLLFDVRRTAGALSLSARTLAEWRRKGVGPEWLRAGRKILYPAEAIHRWIADAKRGSARLKLVVHGTAVADPARNLGPGGCGTDE